MTKRNKGINLSAPAAPAPQDSKAAVTGANDGAEEQNEETGGDEQQDEQHDGDEQQGGGEQNDGQDKDETVTTDSAKTSSDPTEPAVLVEPERGGPARLRSTQFQMYHPYLRVYFHQDGGPDGKGTLIPFVDSWTKCQIDAGLLEEVQEDSNESVE